MHLQRKGRFIVLLYIMWVGLLGLNVAHAFVPHKCKNISNRGHSCRHIGGNGEINKKDHKHVSAVSVARVAMHVALMQEDEASVPPECVCMASCFFSGDGLPSPNFPNDDE